MAGMTAVIGVLGPLQAGLDQPVRGLRPTIYAADRTFRGPEDQYAGGWRSFPATWRSAEDDVLETEVHDALRDALELLPARQWVVLTLRDVIGCSSEEVCDLLEGSAADLAPRTLGTWVTTATTKVSGWRSSLRRCRWGSTSDSASRWSTFSGSA